MTRTLQRSKKDVQRGDIDSSVEILSPKNNVVEIKGKLFYHEGSHSWTLLRLKQQVLTKFPHLKEKIGNFVYLMKLHESYDELKKEIDNLEKDAIAIPIIMFLGKEKGDPNNQNQPSS